MIVKLHKAHLLLQRSLITTKLLKENGYSSLKKILTGLLKDTRLDGLQKSIDRYKAMTMKKPIHLLYALIHQEFYSPSELN